MRSCWKHPIRLWQKLMMMFHCISVILSDLQQSERNPRQHKLWWWWTNFLNYLIQSSPSRVFKMRIDTHTLIGYQRHLAIKSDVAASHLVSFWKFYLVQMHKSRNYWWRLFCCFWLPRTFWRSCCWGKIPLSNWSKNLGLQIGWNIILDCSICIGYSK